MFSKIISKQRSCQLAVTNHNLLTRPNGLQYLSQNKTTSASINAKARASIQAKISASSNPANKITVDSKSSEKKIPKNIPEVAVSKFMNSGSIATAVNKPQKSASQKKSKRPSEVQKANGENIKTSKNENSSKPSKIINPPIISKPKSSVPLRANSEAIKHSSETRQYSNTSSYPIAESCYPSLPQMNPLNSQSQIVPSQIKIAIEKSEQKGTMLNATKSKPLPPNYNSTKRKVTMTMVALPIVLVSSWVLFERLVLGKEQKEVISSGTSKVFKTTDNNAEV